MDAAAEIGAKGLIVHGGHVTDDDDPAKGFDNWRKAVEATDLKIPLLIENTAGGTNAMTRYLERIAGVWDAIESAEGADQVGFCLDTCHAHAGGNALETIVDDVRRITGRIDLVHCQRQPRRLRLRRRPARQLRRREDRSRPARRGGPRRRGAGGAARPPAAPRSTARTSPGSATGSDGRGPAPDSLGG